MVILLYRRSLSARPVESGLETPGLESIDLEGESN
jgi:hypothetical protein